MLFLLLIVGTNAAWAGWQIRGEGWGGASWVSACPNMTNQNGIWYAKLSSVSSAIQFKVMNGNWDGNNQIWWERSSGGANHNSGNANLENANDSDQDGKHRFKYTPSETVDLYIYTDGSQVWANAVAAGTSSLSGHTVKLHGDLWQNPSGSSDGSKGWGDFASCPTLTLAPGASEVASVSFLIPAVPSDASAEAKARFELYDGNTKKDVGESNVIVTGSGVSKAYSSGKITLTISKSSNTHLVAKQVNVHYSLDNKIRISVTDVTLSGDWYLYYDGTLQSGKFTNAAGSITVNNVPADNSGSYHSFFIAKSNSLTGTSVSHPTGNIRQGVVWLGGLYLDKAGSTTVGGVTYTWENKQYRAGSDGFSTYAGFSIKDKGDARGAFKLSETSNVTFTLNNGVITLTAAANGVVIPTDRTYDGNEYMFFHKTQTSTEANHDHDFSNDDARLFVHFKNAGVDNTSERAFFWDADRTIYAVKVPAGTYKTFKIYRISRETDGWYEWNHSYELNLDYVNDYNYLSATSTSAPTWTSYTPPTFRFVLSGTPALSGDNGEFSHWNGNGTVYTGSTTKILNSGTYKFKINPAGVTTANNMWVNEFNWNDIDAANSSNNINLRKNPANDNTEIWFDLETRSEVTIACDGNKVTVNATPSAPEPLSGDYYVFGAGGTNWVTGWSSNWNNEAYKMTIADGVATKTFYNVSGQGLEFKIHKGETEYNNSLLLEEVGENNSHLIKKVWKNGTNIDFSISDINITHKADVTVHFDGEHIWLTAVPHPETVAGSDWYIMGSGNVGTEHNLEWGKDTQKGRGNEHKMTVQDGVATITYYNVPNNSISYKVFRGSDNYEINDFYYDASASSGIICTDQDGNDNINVSLNNQNICIHWDGTKIWTTEAAAPITTYTVTIHPNGGTAVSPLSVGEGQTISSISSTYGNGTAKWYEDEDLTQEFILGTSTVTGDMDLYAKWGVSGNFYLVGDFGMHDKGSNWAFNSGLAMTTTDGVASVTYIAPKGRHRFEILTSRSSWPAIANQGSGLIAASTPTLSWSNEGAGGYYHFRFDLDAPKKVTVRYDGKVSVTAEDYVVAKTGWTVASKSLFGHGTEESPDNADDGAYMNGYNMTEGQMNSDGELVIHNLNAGTYKFWIGKYNTALNKQKQNVEVFGAAHVDKANSSLGDYGSLANVSDDTYNRSIPMDDKLHRRVQFTLNQRASIKIAFDGGKITVNLLPKYTVTFNSNDGSAVASQSVFEGATASEPSAPTKAGCNFQGWQLSGVDYTFSEAVTGNITLDAVWANKAIESVALSESSHTTWIGNSDFTLTLTKDPEDLNAKSVVWSSNNTSVATVSNSTVHVEAGAEITEETVVRITCTVTDQYNVSRSAYCDVTVAPCQMTTDNLYSMNVTGYNSSTGSSATLNGLWNESSDNTEPATFRIVKLKLSDNNYIYDDNGTVKMSTNASLATAQWYEIPIGENFSPDWTGSSFALYEFKNVSTGKYMRRSDVSGGGGDWRYYTTITDNRPEDGTKYQFFYDNTHSKHLVCRANSNSSLQASYCLHRCNSYMDGDNYNNCPMPNVPCGTFTDPDGNAHTKLHETVVVDPSYSNPNYKASQMNSAYYRMKADATVRANLANGLAYGSVITVRLYADAATTVQLTKADGTEIETIDLSADAALDYTYTVNTASLLLGESAFIIKAADNHAAIASISVSRTHAVEPNDPALAWDDVDLETTGITQSALGGNIVHTAASVAGSTGAISYTSSNTAVADIEADGTVLPHMAGSTIITATIEEAGCYGEASITYTITLTEPTLAERIAADAGEGITLTHDYAENIVIDKALTINGNGHSIGNLKVENVGDLTLSGALTVNDFTICAKAGNSEHKAASGQVREASNLTVNGNAYFLYTVDPSGTVHYGWYDFTVPFPVNVMSGIAGIDGSGLNENFVNERDYAIMEFLGDKKAAGQYAYKKFRGIMQPGILYSITLDDDYNYNTIRFKKTDGALAPIASVDLPGHSGEITTKENWNGVGNGSLHHINIGGVSPEVIQVYQSGDKSFLPVDPSSCSFAVGVAFMIQGTGTMTFPQASHVLLAPRRAASAPQRTAIQIAGEGKPFSDQLFISADEMAGQAYTQGVDVAKAGDLGSAKVAQLWTNAYNTPLCAHEAQLINGEAHYALSIYAPANGSYTLTSQNIPDGATLYLTQNGNMIWDLSEAYTLDLTKGTNTEYGLLLVESHKIPTGVDAINSNADTKKIMRNGILYILRNGKVYTAQGAMMQ